MSPPIYTPDGSEVSEIVLPDGSTASEVIGPDGNVVFEAGPDIPDSAVLNTVASNYDGSQWVSDTGPNIPDANGNPSKVSDAINGYPAVVYESGNNDASQTTTALSSSDPTAIIFTSRETTANDNGFLVDGSTAFQFAANDDSNADGWRLFRDEFGAFIADNEGSVDTNWHTYALLGTNQTDLILEIDGSVVASGSGSTSTTLDGLTVGSRGDLANFNGMAVSEITVLSGHTTEEVDNEIQRQMSKYGTPTA